MVAVPASVVSGVTVLVPVPLAALLTVTLGLAPIGVSVPTALDFCLVVQVAAPVVVVARPAV